NFDSRNSDGSACALEQGNPTLGVYRVQMLRPGSWGCGEQDWHLPFIDERDGWQAFSHECELKRVQLNARYAGVSKEADALFGKPPLEKLEILKRVSTARCARVSYFLPESGERSDVKRDLELCDRLSSSGHWSPFEHVARPMPDNIYFGNFRSFCQYRKEFAEEHGGDR